MYRFFKQIAGIGNGNYIYYWQYKGFSDKRIRKPSNSITPYLSSYGTKTRVELKRKLFETR